MQRLLNWLRDAYKSSPSTGDSRTVKPQLEQLDERLVPSATSAVTTPLYGYGYGWQAHDLFAIDQATHHVIDYHNFTYYGYASTPTRTDLGGYADAVSAAVDPNTGYAEVFVRGGVDHSVWRFDLSGNQVRLDYGGGYSGISGARDGQAYAIRGYDQHVVLFHADGSVSDLGNPEGYGQTIISIAAGRNTSGGDQVFVIGQSGALYVNSTNGFLPGIWRLIDSNHQFVAVSATASGGVFAVASPGVYHFTEQWYGGWSNWSGQYMDEAWYPPIHGNFQVDGNGLLSADTDAQGRDELYLIYIHPSYNQNDSGAPTGGGTNELYRWSVGGNGWQDMDSNVSSVAAADGGFFYDVNPTAHGAGEAWLWNPTAWQWTDLGGGVEA